MAEKKYIKLDCENGYLENVDDINYCVINQLRKTSFNNMLGDFDENGLYVVDQKIVRELINMPKVIVEVVEGSDLIRSKVKADAFFHFILTVEENKATFSLLEKINYESNATYYSGAYSNINEYVIDQVVVPDKDFDRTVLYQKYNISTADDGETGSLYEMDEQTLALLYNITQKLKLNFIVQNEIVEKEKETEQIEADYFESVLEAFDLVPEFGEKVKNELKLMLKEKHNFVISTNPFFQKTVNEMLDSCIQKYMGELSIEQKEMFMAKLREIRRKYFEQYEKLLPTEKVKGVGVMFSPNEKKEETIIGSLTKSVTTKGYIEGSAKRITINESELNLPINKIKANLKDTQLRRSRDNSNSSDITRGRKLVSAFYSELKKEHEMDIASPSKSLINEATKQTGVKEETKSAINTATAGGKTVGSGGKTAGGGGKTASGGGKTAGGGGGKAGQSANKKAATKDAKSAKSTAPDKPKKYNVEGTAFVTSNNKDAGQSKDLPDTNYARSISRRYLSKRAESVAEHHRDPIDTNYEIPI